MPPNFLSVFIKKYLGGYGPNTESFGFSSILPDIHENNSCSTPIFNL